MCIRGRCAVGLQKATRGKSPSRRDATDGRAWCPGRGSNPHDHFWSRDFKSRASASFATRATTAKSMTCKTLFHFNESVKLVLVHLFWCSYVRPFAACAEDRLNHEPRKEDPGHGLKFARSVDPQKHSRKAIALLQRRLGNHQLAQKRIGDGGLRWRVLQDADEMAGAAGQYDTGDRWRRQVRAG